jgi:hypothetical protein
MIFLNKDKKILVYGNEKISMFEKENFYIQTYVMIVLF